jgi:pyruvate kinase
MRRTKIIATLGPGTDRPGILKEILASGVDVVRLNLSHGNREEHLERAGQVRQIGKEIDRQVGIMADLPGAKIRICGFRDGQVELTGNDPFVLDPDIPADGGSEQGVGLNYADLASDLSIGDVLFLDDGRIVFEVEKIEGRKIHCLVQESGVLSSNKGVNRQGGGLSSPPLGDRGIQAMQLAVDIDADFVAISFPKSGEDIVKARAALRKLGFGGFIVAKIERSEALPVLDKIILASDIIMIARGDLGVEIGDARLPAIQKRIIRQAQGMNKVVITATQMMESMINNPIPTRAEVFDVANAVLDGTDAVMLSAESAVGNYPVKTVRHMVKICIEAEKQEQARISGHRLESYFANIEETLAMSVMYAANHLQVRAIGTLTESGKTPMLMSRISSGIPIYGISRNRETLRKMTMFRGVHPIFFDVMATDAHHQHTEAAAVLIREGRVGKGDFVITTCGTDPGLSGGTNAMKIIQVP